MSDNIETLIKIAQSVSAEYEGIRKELKEIKLLLGNPAYVIDVGYHPDKKVADSLLKKITGRRFKPGEIIRLTSKEFQLYQDLLPCPPRSP